MQIPSLWETGASRLQRAQLAALAGVDVSSDMGVTMPWRTVYRLLRQYAESNGLYEELVERLRAEGTAQDDIRPIRNPAPRVLKFYTANLWRGQLPDALPIQTDNEAIIDPIRAIWQWSNWSAQKQVCARWLALYGDGFIKVATSGGEDVDRVYLQNISPEVVTAYAVDERGFLAFIRMDTPMIDKKGRYHHTEAWSMKTASLRIWRNEFSPDTRIDDLGAPDEEIALADMGIDFIPISHFRFEDTGDERGVGAFTPVLDKIDEANQKATRLSMMIYRHNKALWALSANAMDSAGRPMAPPTTDSQMEVEDDSILSLPGMATLQSLVPNLPYGDALDDLNAMMKEIGEDLPELAYFSLRDAGDLSGVAVRTLLGDAVARADTVRANGLDGMVRAHKMALTIGQYHELFDGSIGNYDNGDFDHVLDPPDPFAPTWEEIANTVQTLVSAGVPTVAALTMAGASEKTINMVKEEIDAARLRDVDLASAYIAEAERQASRTQGFTTNGA